MNKILEKKDQNKDGKNNFDDVKIARMKASGMSDEEIKKKHPELYESDTPHLRQYGAPQGSKRDKHLDYVKRLLKTADKLEAEGKTAEAKKKRQRAAEAREKEEKNRRDKGDYSRRKRKDTGKYTSKNEAERIEEGLRLLITGMLLENQILERKKRKQQKGKKRAKKTAKRKSSKRKSSSGGLSAATKETLRKKAKRRGLTPSSVYAEFRKGLAAWISSGSRKGMSQHQWAHARVNSATPSKSWAVVKKAKG